MGVAFGYQLPSPGPHNAISADLRGAVWVGTGLAAGFGAWRTLDWWYFALLMLMPMALLASSLVAWVDAIIPGPPPGDPVAWYRASWYLLLIFAVWYATSGGRHNGAARRGD